MARVMPPNATLHALAAAGKGGLWPLGQAAASETEIDELFKQAQMFAFQQTRERLQHALSQSTVESRAEGVEEKLQAAQLRNMELAQRVQLLEGALQRRRAKDAARLLSRPGRPGSAPSTPVPEALKDLGDDSVPESELTEAELAHRRLRDFASRMPRVRKHRIRPNLCKMLRAAGFEHAAASVFWEQVPDNDAGHLEANDAGSGDDPMLQLGFDAGADGSGSGHGEGEVVGSHHSFMRDMDGDSGHGDVVLAGERSRADHIAGGGDPIGRSYRRTAWQMQATLRGHLDGVRSVVCHRDFLFSAGEDTVVKAWDLSFLYQAPTEDGRHLGDSVEAYATYRGHGAAVLSLAFDPQRSGAESANEVGQLFSGGRDGDICVWQLRQPTELDPYDTTPPASCQLPPNSCVARLREHGDAVWSLALHPTLDALASASSDGTIRLWRSRITDGSTAIVGARNNPASIQVTKAPALPGGGTDRPSGLSWVPMRGELLLASFASSRATVFNVERNTALLTFDTGAAPSGPGTAPNAVSSVACHAELAVAVAGHADRSARLYCLGTGQVMQTLQEGEHKDAVTSVAFDPRGGFEVATTSHDGALRIFDIRKGQLLQAMYVHDRKFDEAAHCVSHAGTRLATGGADAGIRIIEAVEYAAAD